MHRAVLRCPLLNVIKYINSTVIEIIEVVEISLCVFLSYELFSIMFINVNLIKIIFLHKRSALQRECELLTSDLDTFLKATSVT